MAKRQGKSSRASRKSNESFGGKTRGVCRKPKKASERKARSGTAHGLTDHRAEVRTLKKLVLLQKVKREFVQKGNIGSVEIDKLIADYLKVILNLTGASGGSVLLHNDGRLVFRACLGPGSKQLIGKSLSQDEGIAGWVYRNGKTYLSPDVVSDKRWSRAISDKLGMKTRNILASPLRTTGDVMGVVEIINKNGGMPFGKDDKEMLESLAGQLSMDISYANLLSTSIRDAQRRVTQMGLAMLLNSSLNQREVRREAIGAVASLLDSEVGSLLLVDEKTNELYFEVALGEKEKQVKQMRLKMGEGIAGWVALKDEPVIINDVQNDLRYFRRAQALTDFITRNMVCVPVRSRGKVVGVLQAINKKEGGPFAEEDLENCLTLANQVAVALENAHLFADQRETFINTAEAFAAAIEKKDPYTGGHIKRVVEYSMAIARHMREPLDDVEDLRLAAALHDIGKIGIKDSVLLKRGALNSDEIAHMREHPLVGEEILGHIEQMKAVRKIMRAHHEKWDGTGYPDGLKGEAIPIHARIIAIADAFDAITTDRPYRKAEGWKSAAEEIKKFSKKDFDPVLVGAFLRACEAGDVTIVQGR